MMEDDKKKKKNKKKKNKSSRTGEAVSVGNGGSTSAIQIPNGFDQSNSVQAAIDPNDAAKACVDVDIHGANGSDASIQEQIKHLQKEKEVYMNPEVELELIISKLQNEKDGWLQKEANLEEKIKQLQKENDECINKEADFVLIVSKLQDEKDSWLHSEAGYKEKIKQLADEASTTSLKKVGLEEKIKQLEIERESCAQNENSFKETIAGLEANNKWLRSQVSELEESWKNLLQENQRLLKKISDMQEQIQNSAHVSTEIRDKENQDIQSELLAAQTMVKKLLSENAELVEKLNIECGQRNKMVELSPSVGSDTVETADSGKGSAIVSDLTSGTAERLLSIPVAESSTLGPDQTAYTAERVAGVIAPDASSKGKSLLDENMKPDENGEDQPEDIDTYSHHEKSSFNTEIETVVSEEIVQIPLDENEAGGGNLQLEGSSSVETSVVPISDAPMIGAPFRFISFMARYVSGADLVNKSP